jgi:hypothetical protein
MSVVGRETRRRWLLVAAGVAVVCLLPVAVAAWPQPRVGTAPQRLRELILASADRPYEGYADSNGRLALPDLPELSDVGGLLSGSTQMRVWYATTRAWRVAVVHPTGERDIYRTDLATYLWDFERNLLTRIDGDLPVRLPWAADLPPPELARRLLRNAAPDDTVTPIESQRVAGVDAPGLRWTPADPATTIGHVDVWADRDTGLPVRVVVAGRGGGDVLTSRFLDLAQRRPDPALLTPSQPVAAGFTTARGPDIAATIRGRSAYVPPGLLAGQPGEAVVPGVPGIVAYGVGLSAFVVVSLPGRLATRSLRAASDGGGAPVEFGGGATGFELRSTVLSTLIVQSGQRTFVLAGLVTPDLLRRAAADLLTAAQELR